MYQKLLITTLLTANIIFIFPVSIHAEVSSQEQTQHVQKTENEEKGNRDYSEKNLHQLIEELSQYNPELKSLVEKIKAAELKIPQASALEDPRLSFEGSNIPIRNPSLNRTAMTGLQIYLRQKVPFPGKLKLKKQMALSQSEQEKQMYYERFNQLIAKFKQSYFEYQYLNQAIQFNQQTQKKLRGLIQFLNARYSTGESSQQDILQTKQEISNITSRLIQLRSQKKLLASRLNTLLYRPQETELKIKALKQLNNDSSSLQVSLETLKKLAKENRPWLKKKAADLEEAQLGEKLAKKSLLPDFDFGAGYRVRQNPPGDPVMGEDFFSAGVSINLPLYAAKNQNKKIQEMVHLQKSEEYLQEATLQEVLYQTEKAYLEATQLQSQIHLLRSQIIPQDWATIESSRASYEATKVDFINLLLSEVTLLNHRTDQVRYQSQYQQKLAEIEMAVGLPLEVIQTTSKNQENSHEK
ncbi:MAG: TolC family protein [Deltaproteobacteria bacterium]|nr:TolC family protein [Deltaproteobacteria bacterium]